MQVAVNLFGRGNDFPFRLDARFELADLRIVNFHDFRRRARAGLRRGLARQCGAFRPDLGQLLRLVKHLIVRGFGQLQQSRAPFDAQCGLCIVLRAGEIASDALFGVVLGSVFVGALILNAIAF
jgi:hypothetical protein